MTSAAGQFDTLNAADRQRSERLLAAALKYAERGLHVLPLLERSKKPDGKLVPQGHLDATTDAQQIAQWWAQAPLANIGVSCAASGWVVIDVDVRSGGFQTLEALEAKYGTIESDVLQLTPTGGRHYVFLASKDRRFPGKLGPGIDIKHDGYICVEPSTHPEGGQYGWESESDPLHGQAVATIAPNWLESLAHAAPESLRFPAPARLIDEQRWGDALDALTFIIADDRPTWLTVGMAIHKDNPTAEGYQGWETWSRSSHKFDAQDQMRVWRSFRRSNIAGVTLDSVFAMAKQQGWINPRSRAAQQMSTAQAVAIVQAQPPIPDEPQVVEPAPLTIKPFPFQGLNELAAWFDGAFESTHPLVSQAATVLTLCTAASRRYESAFGDPAHLFVGVIGPTISTSRYLLDGVDQLMCAAGLGHMVRQTRVASPQQLYGTLNRTPAGVYLAADFGDQLRFARRQPSGLLDSVLHLLATDIAGGKSIKLDNWAEMGVKQPEGSLAQPHIYKPAWSLAALLSGAQVASAFKKSELSRGALDSMLFVHAPYEQWQDRHAVEPINPPAYAIEKLRAMRGLKQGEVPSKLTETAGMCPTCIPVTFHSDLVGLEQRILAEYKKRGQTAKLLASGARRHIRRIATAMAAWQAPDLPYVTEEILSWSSQFVLGCLEHTIANYHGSGDDDKPDVYQTVLDVIAERGAAGMPIGDLHKYCRPFRSLNKERRDELISQMQKDRGIAIVPSPSKKGRCFVHFQFALIPDEAGDAGDILQKSVSREKAYAD
jgi:hypothetical protein